MRKTMILVLILGMLLPATAFAQTGKSIKWETQKFEDTAFPRHVMATVLAPMGGGWDFSYGRVMNGQLSGPNVVFGVTTSVKSMIDECKAKAAGEVTIANRKATLYEGGTKYWGPTKIWVFKERLLETDAEIAMLLGGLKLASFKADVDKILASLKLNLKPPKQ